MQLALVTGRAGVGKSRLVAELQAGRRVASLPVGSGKADQSGREVPHALFLQALGSVLRTILTRSDAVLRTWREVLRQGLGSHGRVLVHSLPALGLIIGPQPPVVEVLPAEARTRFHIAMGRLLAALASAEHPLILFLDDLQWADDATLDLLEHVISRETIRHLLIVGAYRDEGVESNMRLRQLLARLPALHVAVTDLKLVPIGSDAVTSMVADTLSVSPSQVAPLVTLVLDKTQGNPFFVRQYLSALHDGKMLAFDDASRSWRWDDARIRATRFTDDIVDLMTSRLTGLLAGTQELLQTLACLGKSSSTQTLAVAAHLTEPLVHERLADAVDHGLVARDGDGYAFLHDRIQEVAYARLAEDKRASAHLRIGRRLSAATASPVEDDFIFAIVNQYNVGAALLTSPPERRALAALNLRAAIRAKAASAYGAAHLSFSVASDLTDDDTWEDDYALAFAVQLGLAECELLAGDRTAAERRLGALAERVRGRTDQAAVVRVQMAVCANRARFADAVALGCAYLQRGPERWPLRPTHDDIAHEYQELKRLLGTRSMACVADLPPMVDKESVATVDVLQALAEVAFWADEDTFAFSVFRMMTMSVRSGNTAASAYAYMSASPLLRRLFGRDPYNRDDIELANGALALSERSETRFNPSILNAFGYWVVPWARPLHDAIAFHERARQGCFDIGEMTHCGYAHFFEAETAFNCGHFLAEVEKKAEESRDFCRRLAFDHMEFFHATLLGSIRNLRGVTSAFGSFSDSTFDEVDFRSRLEQVPLMAESYWIRRTQASFLAGRYGDAVDAAARAEALTGRQDFFAHAELHLYAALAEGAHARDGGGSKSVLPILDRRRRLLASWAERCDENFRCHVELVDAEVARVEGRVPDVERHYEAALASAREHRFVAKEALAAELAGRFSLKRGLNYAGQALLREARFAYERWGAAGKVKQLEEEFPRLRVEAAAGGILSEPAISAKEYDAVLRASQSVSRATLTSSLLEVVMRTTLEHAGATRGVLVMADGGELRVAATATLAGKTIDVSEGSATLREGGVPESVLRYVARTRETVIIDDVQGGNPHPDDAYLAGSKVRSALCLALSNGVKLVGLLYLENGLVSHAFAPARTAALTMLATQAASSLESSQLYAERDAAEQRLTLIIDTIPTLVWSVDARGAPVFFNRQWLDYTGLSNDDAQTGGWSQSLHPDDARATHDWWNRTLASGRASELEGRLRRADGSYRWFLFRVEALRGEGGSVVQWYATSTDIEARKRGEIELDSRLRYVTMLAQTSALFTSGEDHHIRAALGLIGEFFGYDAVTIFWLSSDKRAASVLHRWSSAPELLLAQTASVEEFPQTASLIFGGGELRLNSLRELPPRERNLLGQRGIRAMAALPLNVRGVTVATMTFVSGKEREWSEEEWPRVRLLGEILASTFGRYHAMRELELSEAALQSARAELAHATRVATLGELAATIAHEVNQPLSAIVSEAAAALNWLSMSADELPRVRESLHSILTAGDRAGQVLTSIRSLIRRSDVQSTSCDVENLVEGVLPLVRGQMERDAISLEARLASGPAPVVGNAIELQQVVLNLVLNAADATREVVRQPRRVVVRSRVENGHDSRIMVSVEDNGVGLGADAARVFDTFYTTKPGGLGMGLSISRSIIERHGGRLWAESNSSGGATFCFSLPLIAG